MKIYGTEQIGDKNSLVGSAKLRQKLVFYVTMMITNSQGQTDMQQRGHKTAWTGKGHDILRTSILQRKKGKKQLTA